MEMKERAEKVKKGIIYCRVAVGGADARRRLEVQAEACRDYAKKQGIEIVNESYMDIGSGNMTDRPALRDVLNYLEGHPEVRNLITQSLDRLSRRVTTVLSLEQQLKKMGVAVHFSSLGCSTGDRGSPGSRVSFILSAVAAEAYSREHSLKVRQGIAAARARREEDRWFPFGYLVCKKCGCKTRLEINPKEAAEVRRIFKQKAKSA